MDLQALGARAAAAAAVLSLAGCATWSSQPAAPSPRAAYAPKPSSADQAPGQTGPQPITHITLAAPSEAAPEQTTAAPLRTTAMIAPPNEDDSEPMTRSGGGADALGSYPDEGPRPLRPIKFHDSVARAGAALLQQARASIGDERRLLVIDPLVDGATGQQTASTVEMGKILADLIRQKYPSLTPSPLTRAALAQKPVLFIGTLTPFNTAGSHEKSADAFRVWLTLIDLRTGRIVAKVIDKATASTVDAVPLSYYRDSPTWPRDKTVAAYINSCTFKTKIGDSADPAYLARLPAAAAINEAMDAFSAGQLADANSLFHEAQSLAEEDDLRILNGLYLTSWRLGHEEEARAAFDRIVAAGLHSQRLPLKFLFVPAKAELLRTGDLGAQYTMWLHEVAKQASLHQACLRVVGHTSRTGTVETNDALSYARANSIRAQLWTDAPDLAQRMTSQGKGFRENLIGLGTDDIRDALDRRVELLVAGC
jgi:outer membrane protein OmpA-like peptidoglycan-associated protein